jgi:hypothetical protein
MRIPAPQILDKPPLALEIGRCRPSVEETIDFGYPKRNSRSESPFTAKADEPFIEGFDTFGL